jgi:hypothetical protein
MKPNRIKEPVAYAMCGSFLHENNGGRASVKTYTSVNEPLKIDAADSTKKIGSIKVSMHVEEDKSVYSSGNQGQIYEKNISIKQTSDAPISGTTNVEGSEQPYNQQTTDTTTPNGLQVLKNFVDELSANQRLIIGSIFVLAVLVGAAFVFAYLK